MPTHSVVTGRERAKRDISVSLTESGSDPEQSPRERLQPQQTTAEQRQEKQKESSENEKKTKNCQSAVAEIVAASSSRKSSRPPRDEPLHRRPQQEHQRIAGKLLDRHSKRGRELSADASPHRCRQQQPKKSAVAERPEPGWNKRSRSRSRPGVESERHPPRPRDKKAEGAKERVPSQSHSDAPSDAPSADQGPSTIACLYVYVGKEANVDEVAVDLRNQAPTILFVCCGDREVAKNMAIALSKKGVDNAPRGDGGKGKGRGDKGEKEDRRAPARRSSK